LLAAAEPGSRRGVTDPAPSAPDTLAARAAALTLLEKALAKRGGLDEALSSGKYLQLSPLDRGFARALVMATLRHLGPIDRALDGKLKREPPPPARNLMRLGLAQAFWMDTPDFAAVDTSVALAPKPLRGLVNAVLRGVLRDGAPSIAPENLAPSWLFARWRVTYGDAAADALALSIVDEPPTDLTLRREPDQAMVEALEATRTPGGGLRTARRGDVATWPGFEAGAWWVQDAAAALPADLLHVAPGQTALDLCAAPGGKSLQLAAAGASVTSVDRAAGRLRRLGAGLARTGLEAELVIADAATWRDPRLFDAVLLDAPCSASGTFRRHPDVLWNARPTEIAPLVVAQRELLQAAAIRVKPGGLLVYSVCSLELEEGEAQARNFLMTHPLFGVAPIRPGEAGAPAESVTPEGWLRILPRHMPGGLDGFFIARFRKAV
jgi:16S rRNA (cytosine967-C5)-methyltransferase